MALTLIYLYYSFSITKMRWGLIEMIAIVIIISQLDPLTGFALYFCFVHTAKHVKAILININNHITNKNFVFKSTAIFTIVTWLGGCIAIIYLSNNFSFSESFIKTIFIGLAALTLPHMALLIIFIEKNLIKKVRYFESNIFIFFVVNNINCKL
jgi:Brp/Blh family beta-carotene 15,15'-monooxygenase